MLAGEAVEVDATSSLVGFEAEGVDVSFVEVTGTGVLTGVDPQARVVKIKINNSIVKARISFSKLNLMPDYIECINKKLLDKFSSSFSTLRKITADLTKST
jgi:hypothetical protein